MSEKPKSIEDKIKELYGLSARMTDALNYGTMGECSISNKNNV